MSGSFLEENQQVDKCIFEIPVLGYVESYKERKTLTVGSNSWVAATNGITFSLTTA